MTGDTVSLVRAAQRGDTMAMNRLLAELTPYARQMADFDEVRRLRVLAAGISGAHVAERLVPAPFGEVWPILSDLENEFTAYEIDTRRVRPERAAWAKSMAWRLLPR